MKVNIKDLTPEQALQWLVANDSEAKDFWESQPVNAELCAAVWDNIREFGTEHQSGPIIVDYEAPKLHTVSVEYVREEDDSDDDYERGVAVAQAIADEKGVPNVSR